MMAVPLVWIEPPQTSEELEVLRETQS